MTPTGEQLCYTDAYLQSIGARVASVETGETAPLIVLDRTVFYPGGGGQPSDRGLIIRADGRPVVDGRAGAQGRVARSSTSSTPARDPPAVGDVLRVDVEWARRLALMRTHTALHALCGVVWRDYGALVTGGNMEPGYGRMDFEFESDVRATWSTPSRRPSTRSWPRPHATSTSTSCRARRRSPSRTSSGPR